MSKKTVLILGAAGMVGSAIKRAYQKVSHQNHEILCPTRQELDLLDQNSVLAYFKKAKPDIVIDAAAKVGGIHANNTFRADFILQNLQIQNNLFEASLKFNVDKFLFLGSSCIYPKNSDQPIKEEYLLTGPLEQTNEPYAIAKIAGLKTAENIRKQYGLNFFSIMPTNLYGENDNFHPENSHVIPALIQRMEKVITQGEQEFEVWGSGKPMREFLYVDDLADACLHLLELDEVKFDWINVGTGVDVTIAELAKTIGELMGFQGKFTFNTNQPDGTPRKLLDVSRINSLGWKHQYDLTKGLEKTINFYQANKDKVRKY